MFKYKHYVPVLKGKRAEFPALGALKSKGRITPLIESVPSAGPREVPRRMSANWPGDSLYFIDLLFLDDPDDNTTPAADTHPVRQCFEEVAEQEQTAIPVTGISRSPGYQSAVQQVISEQERGVCIRLTADDFEDDVEDLDETLQAALAIFDLEPSDADIILDAGSIADASSATVAQLHRAHLDLMPSLAEWRTVTVLAGAFPRSLAPLERGEWNAHSRNDWRGWRRLVTGGHRPGRLPSFGDYGVAHPDLPPEGRATILAQLRYTTPDSWLIWKGSNVFTHPEGYDQFYAICDDIIARPEYRGAAFSQGDTEIQQKAANHDSPGNAETWRRIGTSHHLETVLDQISNLP
jgi:hypothetical protein